MAAALLTGSAVLLGGCTSTFQQNARARLAAQRDVASRASFVVTERTAGVRVGAVDLLSDAGSTAVVVELRNTSGAVQTDLPISVGVVRHGEKVLLNKAATLAWFATHVPSIAAGARATWVFRSPPGRGSKPGDVPFVRIGAAARPSLSTPPAVLPDVRAVSAPTADAPLPTTPDQSPQPRRPVAKGFARVRVTNGSDVTQLGLPVAAVVRSGDRVVAAGVTTLGELPAGEARTVDVPLTGRAAGGTVTASVNPTIFE